MKRNSTNLFVCAAMVVSQIGYVPKGFSTITKTNSANGVTSFTNGEAARAPSVPSLQSAEIPESRKQVVELGLGISEHLKNHPVNPQRPDEEISTIDGSDEPSDIDQDSSKQLMAPSAKPMTRQIYTQEEKNLKISQSRAQIKLSKAMIQGFLGNERELVNSAPKGQQVSAGSLAKIPLALNKMASNKIDTQVNQKDGLLVTPARLSSEFLTMRAKLIEAGKNRQVQTGIKTSVQLNADNTTVKELTKNMSRRANPAQASVGAAAAASTMSAQMIPNSVNLTSRYASRSYWFSSYDYTANLNRNVYTYWAPAGSKNIAVDFNYIDLESGYDFVELYDKYGLCASYTGHHSSFVSQTCLGDFVEIWVYSDSTNNGDLYSGFDVSGFYYWLDTYVPSPYFSVSPNPVIQGKSAFFDAWLTYDLDNYDSELTYCWDFGDYSNIQCYKGSNYNYHTYKALGDYWATLTVSDPDGNYATYGDWVSVLVAPPSFTVGLKASDVSKVNPVELYVDSTSTSGNIDSITVNWGDASPVEALGQLPSYSWQNAYHVYSQAGVFVISVTAKNKSGKVVHTIPISISDTAIAPNLVITNRTVITKIKTSLAGNPYQATVAVKTQDDGQIESLIENTGLLDYQLAATVPANNGYVTSTFKYLYTYVDGNGISRCKASKKWLDCIAGVYGITVTSTDNEGASTTATVNFPTYNFAPQVTNVGYFGNKLAVGSGGAADILRKTHWDFTYGTTAFSRNPVNQQKVWASKGIDISDATNYAFFDRDGTVADYYWEFLEKDQKTRLAACPSVSKSLVATCDFPNFRGKYLARFVVVDNLGKIATMPNSRKWFTSAVMTKIKPVVPPL